MVPCLLGLGSNLGDRNANLAAALEMLAQRQFRIVRRSRDFATRPIGGPVGQSDFLNAAVVAETPLPPSELLKQLHDVERHLGRTRGARWSARTIDLDLLLYDDWTCDGAALEIPHPRLATRRFVLAPSAEIAGDWVHPRFKRTLSELLHHLDSAPDVAAFCGDGQTPCELAAQVRRAIQNLCIIHRGRSDPSEVGPSPKRFTMSDWQLIDDWSPCESWAPKVAFVLMDTGRSESTSWCERCVANLRRRVGCPWILIDIRSPIAAGDEIVAALDGMRRGQ